MAEPAPQPQTIMDNKYELIKPIGKGKFAVVHRAKRLSDDSIVAVKKISVDSMDDKAREKCLKEVRLLQSLQHDNIVQYLDSSIDGDELIIVFEWAAAGDLKRQVRKANERGKPVALVGVGDSRADGIASLSLRARVGDVLPRLRDKMVVG